MEQKSHWHTFWDTYISSYWMFSSNISWCVKKENCANDLHHEKKTWSPDIWLNFYPFSSHYIYHLKTSPGQNILLIYTFLSKMKISLLYVKHSTRIKHLPMLFHIVWWWTKVYPTCLYTSCHVYSLSNFKSWSFMQWRPAIMITRLTAKIWSKGNPMFFMRVNIHVVWPFLTVQTSLW